MNDLSPVIESMQTKGIANRSELIGVSQLERKALEQYFGLNFPEWYREFLHQFGRSAGFLSPWRAMYFDDLKEIKESFKEQARTLARAIQLPPKTLLIAQLESVFDFIVCNGHANPKVYRVDLNRPAQIYVQANSFGEYLVNLVNDANNGVIIDESFNDDSYWPKEDVIRF